MRDLWKTLIFVGVALLLTGAAIIRIPDRTGGTAAFNDQGEKFFPKFTNPLECTDLEVVDYEPSTAMQRRFQVKFVNGKWVIPSHYNYPADAKDRLAKTAGAVTDLTKDTIRSDQVEDQAALNVLDPLDPKVSDPKGPGKRVTLRDKSEQVLADFIVGQEVKGHPGQRYVRVPGQKRIYGVNNKAELSTNFSDWIETNLLQLEAGKIRRVKFDNHKVNPEAGVIQQGEIVTIERKDSFGPWSIVGQKLEPGMDMNTEKLQAMATALADLKIVGVRPKPPGLTKDLKIELTANARTQRLAVDSLNSKGFYPYKNALYSNQGAVVVETDEGVVYTLRFGEVCFASGLELTAGSPDEAASKDAKGKDAKKSADATENRYLMLTVAFDPSLLPPEHPPEPDTGADEMPDDPFEKPADDPTRIAEEKAAKEKKERETKDHEKRLADGKKKVTDLTDRFAGWYYVTPGDSFHSIAVKKEDLTKKKDDKPPGGAPGGFPPGLQGIQGLQGLPPGHPQ